MHELIFLQDLALVMVISAAIMIFCHRFHLPVVLGYIVAGVIIGPHTPPFPLISDIHSIQTLSELGVIFLLFSIGLEFSFSKLAKVGLVAFTAATLEILFMIWVGFCMGRLFGWNFMNSLFLGAILSISSTTIIAKVLIETKKLKEGFAQIILGILIIEDLLAIVLIAMLSGVAATGSLEVNALLLSMARVFSFVTALLVFGFFLVPRLLRYIAKFESDEMLVITVLGLCFAVSLLTARLGFSVALGAFITGAIIAETRFAHRTVLKMEPIRDMFTAIFFVSVGMLIEPQILMKYGGPIMIIALVTIIGKLFSCSLAAFLTGSSGETSLKVGLGLAQIGEFSFIIARLGESAEVTSPFLYPTAVSVSAITTLTTPFLMKNTGAIIRGLSWLTPRPLQTALGLYTSWTGRLGENSGLKTSLWNSLKAHVPRLLFYVFAAAFIFYGGRHYQPAVPFLPHNLYWAALGLPILPLFVGVVYSVDKILGGLLTAGMGGAENRGPEYGVIRKSLRFLTVLVAGLVFILMASTVLPPPLLVLGAAGLILISGFFLWGSLRKIHERVEKTVLGIFDQEKPLEMQERKARHDELVQLIQEEYPWEVITQDFILPFQKSAVNQAIRDLRLRGETGASIVAIYRGEESIPNPSAETVLLPGDVLLLMGDPNQIKAALEFLTKKIKEAPAAEIKREGAPRTAAFEVPEHSPVIGVSIRRLKLRRKTGVSILGIQRKEGAVNNPDPDTLIEPGDTLVLFGWDDQIKPAFEYLASFKQRLE